MTESSVAVPTTTTTELATDEVAGRHFQEVKIRDGAEGGTNRLSVGTRGEVVVADEFVQFLGLVTPVSTSYLEGQNIGGNFRLDGIPQGQYAVDSISVVGIAGQDLSGIDFDLFGYSIAPGDGDVAVSDGDAIDVNFISGPGQPVTIPNLLLGWETWPAAPTVRSAYGILQSPRPLAMTLIDATASDLLTPCSLCLGIYAAGAIVTDLSAGPLIVSIGTRSLGNRISQVSVFG